MNREAKSVRNYTIYAIIGTVVEESLLFAALYWGLPYMGVHIPFWWIIIIMLLSIAFSYFTYYMGQKALRNRIVSGTEAIIGGTGRVLTPLNPTGYIKIKGETWKAICDKEVEVDDEVTVISAQGLTLKVTAITKIR